ncbi:MAG: ATP-binding cassette domain-containing protein [Truepera sp.]|nr:ATP-binding cassette domain-containing protein [Truepera sp.]
MIDVKNLHKSFGPVHAVTDLSFSVAAGEVFGLLGPNGAGKTTTLRILATLLKPDRGQATVGGFDVLTQAEQVRSSIGVVNGGMGLYDRLTGREVLHYFGKLYRLTPPQIEARIEMLDALLELGDTLKRRCDEFSTGMKQKIVIARAVIHDPPIIFFDEATVGLDVMARRAVINFVKRYPSETRTVVYSTHVMSEVEELCDRAAIIYQGRLVALDNVAALKAQHGAKSLEQAFFAIVEGSQEVLA